MSRRKGRRARSFPSRAGAAPRADLGPVAVSLAVSSVPRRGGRNSEMSSSQAEGAGGILAELQDCHRRAFRSAWDLDVGTLSVSVDWHAQFDALESLWVFLLDLVDVGYGEWSLHDGRGALIIEAEVFGPDVQLEFASEQGEPRFKGQRLPRRALVRVRAMVEQGVGLIRHVLRELSEVDADFGQGDAVGPFEQDLQEIVASVSGLPLEFRAKKADSSGGTGSTEQEVL